MPLLLPFFKFNVSDWLTSEKIALMSPPHIGAYIMLLAQCWSQANCTIPSEVGVLKKLSRWDDDLYGDFGPVLACFERLNKQTDRLTNRRLYTEWVETRQRLHLLSESGQRGAEKRWAKKAKPVSNGHAILKGKTALPAEWALSPEFIASWQQHGINPHIEFASFKDHARTTDRRCKDWEAALRNWNRKAIAKKEARP